MPELADRAASDDMGTAAQPFPAAQPIGSPTVSRAVYGFLAEGRAFDSYHFTVDVPVVTRLDLLVPARSDFAGFAPELRVYEEGIGRELEVALGSGEVEYEPFSVESFREVWSAELELRPDVDYHVVVGPGSGKPSGPYVLAFSGPESFSAQEIGATLVDLPVIWSGGWAGAPIRPAAWGCCGSLIVLGVLLVALVSLRRRRRSKTVGP